MLKRFLTLLTICSPAATFAAPLPMEQVAPGIYVHHGVHKDINVGYGGDICNIGFIVGNQGVAVIDTGGSPKIGLQLREAIRKVTGLPIRYVINTHVHPDHVFGNAAFKEDHPVYVGHEKLPGAMVQRSDAYMRNQPNWVGADATGSELIPPTLTVSETQSLDLGGRTLQLMAHPVAHTNNDLTVFDIKTATLWTGDLLFVNRTPSIDGDLKGWMKVIEKLQLIPAVRVVPGHGPVIESWKSELDKERHYLSVLLQDVRESIQQGRSMMETIESAAQSEKGGWVLFNIVNRRNVSLVYPVLEWE